MSTAPLDEVHIASFVIQHRDDAMPALEAMIALHADLELALRSDTRSVVLCESGDRHRVMERVDQLNAVPGVLNVLLVYHHAEPSAALDEPVSHPSFAANARGALAGAPHDAISSGPPPPPPRPQPRACRFPGAAPT